MRTILNKLLYEQLDKHDTILATIVRENGSTPRGKGAMMLVSKYGRQVGTIGGGAVEKKSEDLALELLEKKESRLHDFILRPNKQEDIGMVCGGDVTVYFQFIARDDKAWNDLALAVMHAADDHVKSDFVLHTDGSLASLVGADGTLLAGGPLEDAVLKQVADSGSGLPLGGDGWFSSPVPIGERVILFGGGHIAQALTPILTAVDFRVTVMDCRPEYATKEYFPAAETIVVGDYTKIADYLETGADDYLVVMTHGHSFDFEIQDQILRKPFAYVGVIGSAKKTASVNARLHAAGVSPEMTARIHTPIGLKIKAITPEEIAVSIAAEMILCRAENREGITR